VAFGARRVDIPKNGPAELQRIYTVPFDAVVEDDQAYENQLELTNVGARTNWGREAVDLVAGCDHTFCGWTG